MANGRGEIQYLTSFRPRVSYSAGNQPGIPLLLLLLMVECQQQKSYDCSTQVSTPVALHSFEFALL